MEDQEPATPPRDFPMPFSDAIMDAVIPTTFVGPKATFTGVEDPEAHLMAFHRQMMLVGARSDVEQWPILLQKERSTRSAHALSPRAHEHQVDLNP